MDTSQKGHQETPPHLEQKNLIEFLESLHRIFKIGIYYPAGHKVLDQAAEHFRRNIKKIADTNRSVFIEIQRDTLFIEKIEVTARSNALLEFQNLILDLGIRVIEIDRAILLPELLQFVKSLLFGRSHLQGIKEFTQAKIDNLPSSVRILQKEFLVSNSAVMLDSNAEDAGDDLNTVFQFLAEQGLERDKIEQCKKFLNDLTTRFSSTPINIKELPTVTWNDVRGLLVKVVSNAYHLSDESSGNFVQNELSNISSIFKGLQREIKDTESQATINLLVSAFSGSSLNRQQPAVEEKRAIGIRSADNTSLQSVEMLQSFVDNNFVHLKTLAKINQTDRREELAILLQLLQWKQEKEVEDKIRKNLRDILTTMLNKGETETLTRGVTDLATRIDSNRFYDIIHFLLLVFRNAKSVSPQKFLLIICQKVSPAVRIALWPILVNEILASGRAVNQVVFNELVTMAAELSGDEMKGRWQELEVMDCFQEKKIAADIFDPKIKRAFSLFSFLLDTTLKRQIGARILSSLEADPPDWVIEAVAPLLQLSIPQHMKFLQIYLLVVQQEHFTANLLMAAGTLVVHHLPEISEQQMNEPWVIKAIKATPEMQIAETRRFLERIILEKRMYIIPKWPSGCRQAAAKALEKLRCRPL